MKNKLLTALFGICLVLFMLTFCIGLPIYCRFFYYIQIKTLDLEEQTGWSYGTIKEAYDEVLDYLTLPGKQFGTGELKWSEDGKAHFDDCKVLFDLNLGLLLSSGAVLSRLGARARSIFLLRNRNACAYRNTCLLDIYKLRTCV